MTTLKSEKIKNDENLVFPKLGVIFERQSEKIMIADYFLPVGYLLAIPPPDVDIKLMKSKIGNCKINDATSKKTIETWRKQISEEWKHEIKSELFSTSKNSRSRRSIVVGIALTVSFLVGLFAMRHYNTNEENHLRDRIHSSELQVDEHSHLFKRLITEDQQNFRNVNEMFCNLYMTENEHHVKKFINEKKQFTQQLLMMASENKLPMRSESKLDLFGMCVQLQKQRNLITPDHNALCHQWAARQTTAEFKGAIIDHFDTIKVKYEIKVPIFSKDISSNFVFKTVNLGFFQNNQKYKINLSSSVVYLSNSKIYETSDCLETVCALSDLTHSKCATSLILTKSSEFCESRKIPSACSFHFHANKYLVSLNGTFISDQKTFKSQSNFLASKGTALCFDGHATELIEKYDLSYETNLKSIFIGIEFNDTNLTYSQNLTKEISSLKNITVTDSIDRVNILIYINLSLLSIILCSVIAFIARKISQCKIADVTTT